MYEDIGERHCSHTAFMRQKDDEFNRPMHEFAERGWRR